MKCGIVCGFRAEHRVAARISPLSAIGWKRPDAARSLLDRGATCLLSFGLAGALDPALKTGQLFLPSHIVMPDGSERQTDRDFCQLLHGCLPSAGFGKFYGASTVVASISAKQAIFQKTGAVGVDMESADLADAAYKARIPFAILRVISDEANDALPQAALVGLNDVGETAVGPVLKALLRNPGQLPSLLRVGKQSRQALEILNDCVSGLKPLFAQH